MFNPANIPTIGGRSATGEVSGQEVGELRKALEQGYGTDVTNLTGAGNLRIQSLDKTLYSTIQENSHFELFNLLQKGQATTTVDEWTEQSGIGGFLGGSTNSESGVIPSAQGEYKRRVGMVKFLMTRREVSYVTLQSNNIIQAQAVENQNAALQLLTDAEFLCFDGDDTVVPTEFPGLFTQISDYNETDSVIDAEGESIIDVSLVDKAAARIASAGNYGRASHIFASMQVQSDLNQNLDPAFRVAINGSAQSLLLGAPVTGINTSWGQIATINDVFIRDETQLKPFEVYHASVAAANVGLQPTAALTSGAGAATSKFATNHAGLYYYRITGLNASGESTSIVSAQQTIPAGGQCSIAITDSAVSAETGYAIYRSRKNGTSDLEDMRLMCRIPKAGGTTTWVDENRFIPGTTKAFILTMKNNAISWQKYLPMTKFDLFPTNSAVVPWAVLLFGYLRIMKRNQHIVIKNISPWAADWRPFD